MVFNYLIIRNPAFFGLLYSGGLLIIAFLFEYVGKYIPCQMCIWQRWPHIGVLFFCLLVIFYSKYSKLFMLLAIACAFLSSLIGFWHSGVELGVFNLPISCSNIDTSPITSLNDLLNTPVYGCDVVVWSFLGLSMTNWNTMLSLLEAFILLYLGFFNKNFNLNLPLLSKKN